MKTIFSVLLLSLTSLLAFTPHSARAQASNEKLGTGALQSNTTGSYNVALGDYTLFANTTGTSNTANGTAALFFNTTGNGNTASGMTALLYNTTGNENTASGTSALYYNTTGYSNTASGVRALYQNTEGYYNTASGFRSLFSNHTGYSNTANGVNTLWANSTGTFNTASGDAALYSNNGYGNTAGGASALYRNTTGSYNTASGLSALFYNTTGDENTATGDSALLSNTTGSYNIAIGFFAGSNLTTGSNNIDIGNTGIAGESNAIRIGRTDSNGPTYIAGIYGSVATNGGPVYVNSDGKLGTGPSSRRFKKDIADMGAASEALLALRPVSFHYKEEFESKGIPQFGLIAEEVANICPDLVLRDGKGEIYSVRYEAVNAMLLNEFLKQHRKVQEQQTTINDLKSTVAQQQEGMKVFAATLREQASQIQKVSAQIEASRPAPKTALNSRW
jgi:trimeric autotransporter adhesin